MSTLFVSDVHLTEDAPERTERFIRFLETRVPGHDLVVLGDLFDWWYGLPGQVPPDVARVTSLLRRANSVLWMEGNHDVHIGRAFPGSTPLGFAADPIDVELAGRRMHLAHGDLVDRGEHSYRAFRALLRGLPGRFAAGLLGHRITRAVGGLAARRSRHLQGGVDGYDGLSERWLGCAKAYAAAQSADLTVLGHGHWLGWWPEGLICLGDWLVHDSYLRIDPDGVMGLYRYVADGDRLLMEEPAGSIAR